VIGVVISSRSGSSWWGERVPPPGPPKCRCSGDCRAAVQGRGWRALPPGAGVGARQPQALVMFAANHFAGPVEAQSVVVKRAADQGAAENPWHDCPGLRVLPGPGHLRIIRTAEKRLRSCASNATPAGQATRSPAPVSAGPSWGWGFEGVLGPRFAASARPQTHLTPGTPRYSTPDPVKP
jgi:hypothetical protein